MSLHEKLTQKPTFANGTRIDVSTLLTDVRDSRNEKVDYDDMVQDKQFVVIFVGAGFCGHCQNVSQSMMSHPDFEETGEDVDEEDGKGEYVMVFINADPEDLDGHEEYISGKPFYSASLDLCKTLQPIVDNFYEIKGYPTFKIHRIRDGAPITDIESSFIQRQFLDGKSIKPLLARYV